MSTKMKKNYVAPETISVKLDSVSLICNSDFDMQGERIDYGDPTNLTW